MEYKAEIFDQLQMLYETTGFNDHQLHCVMRFPTCLDTDILRQAFLTSIEAIPILGTRYVDDTRRPRWESTDPSRREEAFVIARTERELDGFVTSRIDETRGPQVRACLLGSGVPTLALNMNHMVSDGAGFKAYLYFLCDIYTRLVSGANPRPAPIVGNRGMEGVLEHFSAVTKLSALVRQSAESNASGKFRFPLGDDGDLQPFILTHSLARERTAALKAYSKARAATLNDVVLTAYYRCLFRRLALPEGTVLRIPLMVDMRRYGVAGADFTTLSNLSSTVTVGLNCRPNEEFADTLERIRTEMARKKISNIGLNAFVKLDLLFRLFPNGRANHRLKTGLKNPLICMTNVGILDSIRLSFAGIRPHDAFVCGSIKHKPHFQLAVSTYEGELTFSSNLYGSPTDRERISTFLEEIEKELNEAAHAGHSLAAAF